MNVTTVEDISNKIIIEFAKTIEMFGMAPLEARLFVYLYLKNKPQTLDEMGAALGKSKTSMSTSIRSLSGANLVTRVWRKGVRKDLYEANHQIFKTFMNNYINKWLDASAHQMDALETIQQELHEHPNRKTSDLNELSDYLNQMIDFHIQLRESFRQLNVDD
ncbi:GbsR/MarR family transcriptional regulator [Salinibacillus aidingensis]|uniref:HTH-type transcriptional regulator n=1 Tax=Salinibacillus aidingensis TaxID=237684 RepID=A0ABP3L2X3_9BACI